VLLCRLQGMPARCSLYKCSSSTDYNVLQASRVRCSVVHTVCRVTALRPIKCVVAATAACTAHTASVLANACDTDNNNNTPTDASQQQLKQTGTAGVCAAVQPLSEAAVRAMASHLRTLVRYATLSLAMRKCADSNCVKTPRRYTRCYLIHR
jgi:hypothetical protein